MIEPDSKGQKWLMVFWQEGTVVCVLSSDIPSEKVVQLAFAKAMLSGPPP